MVNWYVDEGLQTLDRQWKAEHPGAVVYHIGDASHLSHGSEHNPEPAGSAPGADKGEVDAGDYMPGHGVTEEDLADLRAQLLRERDPRLLYIIWHDLIVSSVVQPWVVRHYNGKWHDHLHISLNDKYDSNTAPWDLTKDVPMPPTMIDVDGKLPLLRLGMEDIPGKARHIWRLQRVLGVDADGVYGAHTSAAVRKWMADDPKRSNTSGTIVALPEWRGIYGIW